MPAAFMVAFASACSAAAKKVNLADSECFSMRFFTASAYSDASLPVSLRSWSVTCKSDGGLA